jgi:hypothetical protein
MHSRALRILFLIVCICSVAAAAIFIRSVEATLTARRAALRDFDRFAREADAALADARAAQQAYVAPGQGADYWMSKAGAATERLTGALSTLEPSAADASSRSMIGQAVAAVTEFANVDARVRQYLKNDELLMAADIVFSEGGAAAEGVRQHLERALTEEHVAFDRLEADNQQMEIAAAGGAAGFVLFVTAILALVRSKAPVEVEAVSWSRLASSAGDRQAAGSVSAADRDLPLRGGEAAERNLRSVTTAQPADLPGQAIPVALDSVARICTDIGRVGDQEALMRLLSQAAEVLGASGLVLWVGTESGSELRPALAHGYSPDIVSRIPAVPRSANNAAAAAYRSGTLQIVLSQSGSRSKGAIVAPVLSADGCVGVLSAEIRGGGEASATVQSLAAIFAAQLAGVVAATSASVVPEQRATGSGAA